MTIRFAAAQRGESRSVARVLCASVPLKSVNDNGWTLAGDGVAQASLRHFARHGLGAARAAHEAAAAALEAGNDDDFQLWLAICRTFDRRLAEGLRGGRQS